jgi:putative transposase
MNESAFRSNRPKPVKFNIPGHAHELTFSCFRRLPLLKSRPAKEFLSDSVNAAQIIHNFEVWAYVFMLEHVHLLIYPLSGEYSISDILKSIKQPSSRRTINYWRENKPAILACLETGLKRPRYRFWQDGTGYDRNYYTPEEIRRQVDYIHNNPVKRGLVENPADWKWSSAAYWMKDGPTPVITKRNHFPM